MNARLSADPKVKAEMEERARSVRENLERTTYYPPAEGDARRTVRTAEAPREAPVAGLCAILEDQIAQTAAAVDDGNAKLSRAATPDELQSLKAGVEFAELKLQALIKERIAKEGDRLAEVLDNVRVADEMDSPMPALIDRRKTLLVELDSIDKQITMHEAPAQRSFAAAHRAQVALDLWRSPRQVEQTQRDQVERELRLRLETLGRTAIR